MGPGPEFNFRNQRRQDELHTLFLDRNRWLGGLKLLQVLAKGCCHALAQPGANTANVNEIMAFVGREQETPNPATVKA